VVKLLNALNPPKPKKQPKQPETPKQEPAKLEAAGAHEAKPIIEEAK